MAKTKTKKTKAKSSASKPKAAAKSAKKVAKKAPAKLRAKSQTPKPKASAKPIVDAKAKIAKKEKTKKPKAGPEENDLVDDFEAADFDGGSEIAEYEDDLREVEAEEEDTNVSGDNWEQESVNRDPEEVILTDAEGNRYCRARDCDQIAIVDAYCRYHYLLFWKKIQVRKKILSDGKLERYVEELTSRYPDKFLEMIRRDLRTEKDFVSAIQELEIDESGLDNEYEEDTQTYIDEVRGIGESAASVEDEEF